MSYNRIVISSGHSRYVRGAAGILEEVMEARRLTEKLAGELRDRGIDVMTFHDDTSQSQDENLKTIVDYHNGRERDLDVSIHFNAYVETDSPMGCEVLYVSENALAAQMSSAISKAGNFIDRGPKKRTDLYFLNNTDQPAILIETCFVDSATDAENYALYLDLICEAIADVFCGGDEQPIEEPTSSVIGKCSAFGGPDDTGVDADEGLAFISDVMQAPHLFLPYQPEGTTGLARRLNPFMHYIACRWNYDEISKEDLLNEVVVVRAVRTGFVLEAFPADWGPNENTGRVADLSPGLMNDLGLETDDEVEVTFKGAQS
jgi:hypothetical protein